MKRNIIILLDIAIFIYLIFAVTAFNKPKQMVTKCTKVNIDIVDESTYGFLDANEIKGILQRHGCYPLNMLIDSISPRQIESLLCHSPFVNTAECCKTHDGHVLITVTQRSPLVRIKGNNGDDYYLDENGGIMPRSKYTSDLIIVTGAVSKVYARRYVAPLARTVMADDFWRNQIEQINVIPDLGIELVPRVGNHILYIGALPTAPRQSQRNEDVARYVTDKLYRLMLFYKHGLSVAGWNKYQRIDVEYDNQIICKRFPDKMPQITMPVNDGYSPEQQMQNAKPAETVTPQAPETTTQQKKKTD